MQRQVLAVGRVAIAAAMLVLAAPAAVPAQKAEALRIEFKRGAYGATLNDKVRGDEEAEFVLDARQGQRLTITLTSVPDKSAVFELFAEGDYDHKLEQASVRYSGVLAKTGDYFITVKRPAGAKGTSRFRMAVTVR
jgi:hypothetical protein